jgi:membrane fusion protein, multidrug efflux system
MTIRKNVTQLLLLCSISYFLAGCGAEAKDEKKDEIVETPVEVAEVYTGDISSNYLSVASISAERQTVIVSKASGIVEKLLVEEGDQVVKGQALAQLDTEQLTLELKQAEANLKRLENELKRSQKIYRKNLVSSDTFERAKYDYESQSASFELVKLRFEHATIRAPFDGVITQRHIKVGNMVNVNGQTFGLTDFNSLKGEIFVPEKQYSRLAVEQRAIVAVDAIPGRVFNGTIERISPIIDQLSGTFKIVIALQNDDLKLRPGMFARFQIIADTHTDAILVNKNAIISQDQETSVFLVKDGKAVRQPVSLGFIEGDVAEIISGVNLGDTLVVTGQHTLKDATPVKVVSL